MVFPKRKVPLIEFFVSEVQKYPGIWDKTSEKYKNTYQKSNAWNVILNNMRGSFGRKVLSQNNLDSIDCLKKQFKNLRDSFFKAKKDLKPKSGSGRDAVPAIWPFYQQVKHLVSFTIHVTIYERILLW